ncbi:MAG: 2-oxoacid:acceptor oxidoreductase subunit alpha [Candidatus Thermoplasmatota archaeon]|nr:2-oxoacid:acceptor oxidoreductase subunit alpha [Candidatus Thermoplasmatota archaeon]
MPEGDVAIRIGGAAGDGVTSTGEVYAIACARSGLHVTTYESYQSVIRGGHVWFQIRAANEKRYSQGDTFQLLIGLDQQTLDVHAPLLSAPGGVIHDNDRHDLDEGILPEGVQSLPVPAQAISMDVSGKPLMQNVATLGALAHHVGLDLKVLHGSLAKMFGRKGEEIVKLNETVAERGYRHAAKQHKPFEFALRPNGEGRLLMSGHESLCLGALAGGVKLVAQYPMTPASGIMHWMAAHAKDYGVLVKQTEDELAAMNLVIGANFAGARAMTATSGGGYALMVEATGLAGMTETPAVIVEAQRVGPSTGLPTKTEQGDLQMVFGASQGDFPRIILAPRSPEECYEAAWRAFNLAESYQCPVFILTDLYLGEMWRTVEPPDFQVPIIRGLVAEDGGEGYRRYEITESGVSPRAFPGQAGLMFIAGSDEHDEKGELISDIRAGLPEYVDTRTRMMEKRMRKLETALNEMKPPELWGPEDADLTIVSWGSTQAAVRDALEILKGTGITANSLEFFDLWPLRVDEARRALEAASETLMVEGNYTGQFHRLLRAETGIALGHALRKYDGEPFYPREIVAKAEEVLRGR